MLKLKGVEALVGSKYVGLRPARFAERNSRSTASDASDLRYVLEGLSLRFVPIPTRSATLRYWYIPQFSKLTVPTSSFEFFDFEEFIVQGAAARCAIKEESDPSPFLMLQQAEAKNIELAAPVRNAEEPGSVGSVDDDEDAFGWV